MNVIRGLVSLLGRLLIVPVVLLSAVGNTIPRFGAVAESMAEQGVPEPRILLVGAIVLLIVGSLSIALGDRARLGRSCCWCSSGRPPTPSTTAGTCQTKTSRGS